MSTTAINVGDFVQLTAPAADLKTDMLDNAWLVRIAAAVGDERGRVTSVETDERTGEMLGIDFPETYRGSFHGIPAAMARKVEA